MPGGTEERDRWYRQRAADVAARPGNAAAGRTRWEEGTRKGQPVSGRTPSELERLGAMARTKPAGVPPRPWGLDWREVALVADTAVRGAADVATFGLSDEIAAGGDALLGIGGAGGLGVRYQRNLAQQEARNRYDAEHRRAARAVGEVGATGALYASGAGAGAAWAKGLAPRAKGVLGEGLSLVKSVAKGDLPVAVQVRTPLSKSFTVADHRTLRGATVEAKFGPYARLSKPQRLAEKEVVGYRVDRWGPHHVGRGTGTLAAGGSVVSTGLSNRGR